MTLNHAVVDSVVPPDTGGSTGSDCKLAAHLRSPGEPRLEKFRVSNSSLRLAYFVFQLQAVGIFTPYRDFSRVSLISLCLKTFRGVARSKPILGGLIYFYRLEIATKRNGVYLSLSN